MDAKQPEISVFRPYLPGKACNVPLRFVKSGY